MWESTVIMKNGSLKILMVLHVSGSMNTEKEVFRLLFVCMYKCVWTVSQIVIIFDIYKFIHHRSVVPSVKMETRLVVCCYEISQKSGNLLEGY